MKFRLALLITALVPTPALANYCAAPLSRTNTTLTGTNVVNTYFPIAANFVSGVAVTLGPGRGANSDLYVGDLLLIWQPQLMQMVGITAPSSNPNTFGDRVTGAGWTAINNTGKFVWFRVTGNATDDLPHGSLAKSYASTQDVRVMKGDGFGPPISIEINNNQTIRTAQAIRVPQYGNLTINGTVTAEPFMETVESGGGLGPQSTGGIVALDVAGALTFGPGGKIDVSALGFRGGAGIAMAGYNEPGSAPTNLATTTRHYAVSTTASPSRPYGGMKGEGGAGTPHRVYHQGTLRSPSYPAVASTEGYGGNTTNPFAYGRGAPGNAGGGGTDQCPYGPATSSSDSGTMCANGALTYRGARLNTGGGGGGGAGAGGQGGNQDYDGTGATNAPAGGGLGGKGVYPHTVYPAGPARPGGAHQYAMLGGGGGAGMTNNSTTPLASSGGTGGGAVLVRAGTIAGSGQVLADGGDAPDVTNLDANGQGDGGGGGGAGGWILLAARLPSTPTLTLSAKGGAGGDATLGMGPGGGGGGGYIGTSTVLPAPSSLGVTGGAPGQTSGIPVRSTNLSVSNNPVASTGAASGEAGAVGQFLGTALSLPYDSAPAPANSSISVAPGPQCVPIVTKQFSDDNGATWKSAVTMPNNSTFKMRITIENPNQDDIGTGLTLPHLFENISFTDTYGSNIVTATPPNVTQSGCGSAGITATAGAGTLTVSGGSVQAQSTCTITADLRVTAVGTWPNTLAAESVQLTQNVLTLKNYEAVGATVTVPSGIEATKTSTVVSDPISNTSNPKRIPGSTVDYTIAINNPTASLLDNDSMIMSDSLPTTTRLFVGDLSSGAPFQFTAGTSGLTCPFVSLAAQNDCVDFSTDGVTWTYVPTPAGDNTDAAVRFVRFRTSGSMAASGNFSVRYRVVVK